jgi:hypothetical protein
MNFARFLPDWNSLDSVRGAHSNLELAALIFFALLVIFEVLSHISEDKAKERLFEKIGLCCFAVAVLAEIVAYRYGQRNDFLSGQVINSLDQKSKEADLRLTGIENKAENIDTRLNSASSQLIEIEAGAAWRHLTSKQKMDISKRLRDSRPSSEVTMWFFQGDAEAWNFAVDIVEMLREAKISTFPPREFGPLIPTGKTFSINDSLQGSATGIKITSTTDTASLSLASAITRELNNCGFDAKIIKSDGPTSLATKIGPNVIVAVLARPNGPQGEAKLRVNRKQHSNPIPK